MSIVAEIATNEKAMEGVKQMEDFLTADPEVNALLEAAEDIKGAFNAVKKFVTVKFEVFENYCREAMDYFKEDKVALQDEMLDCVAGGFSWSAMWKKVAAVTICAVIGAGLGALAGAGTAGPVGAIVGAVAGAIGGGVVGALC